jgi:fluoroquinolone transport system permease protein
MFKSILKLARSDCRIIAHDPVILSLLSGPLLIIIILKLFFPVFSDIVYSKSGFHIKEYYPVIAITLVCLIPYLNGMIYLHILRHGNGYLSSDRKATPDRSDSFLLIRMFFIVFQSFVFILLTILLINPVSSEGWLRNLFAACLLSFQAPFICLMIRTLVLKKMKQIPVFIVSIIFLIAVPFGLLVHHPWNYLVFFSPFYWVAWAWIIRIPAEGFIYGAISVIITSVALTVFLSSLLRKKVSE